MAVRHQELVSLKSFGFASKIYDRVSQVTGVSRKRLEPVVFVSTDENKARAESSASPESLGHYRPYTHSIHLFGETLRLTDLEHESLHSVREVLSTNLERRRFKDLLRFNEPLANQSDPKRMAVYSTLTYPLYFPLTAAIGCLTALAQGHRTPGEVLKMTAVGGLLAPVAAGVFSSIPAIVASRKMQQLVKRGGVDEVIALCMLERPSALFSGRQLARLENKGLLVKRGANRVFTKEGEKWLASRKEKIDSFLESVESARLKEF